MPARLRPTRRESRVVGGGQRLLHDAREISAVVGEDEPGLERHGGGRDQVPPAQLHGVDAELTGGHVDDALDGVGCLRAPRPAIRPGERGVGEHARAR